MLQTISIETFFQHFSRFKPDLSGFTLEGLDTRALEEIVRGDLSVLRKNPDWSRLAYQGFTWLHFMVLCIGEELEKFVYLIQDVQVDINSIATNFYIVSGQDEMRHTSSGSFFHMLLAYEGIDTAKKLIPLLAKKNFNINCNDGENKTVLITAAKIRATEVVCQLLETFKDTININAQDSDGRTALHYAAAYGAIDMVTALLKAGATWQYKDKLGNTPLMYADIQQKDCIHMMFLSIEILSERDMLRRTNILQLPISSNHQALIKALVKEKCMLISNKNNLQQLSEYGKTNDWPEELMQVINSILENSGKTLLQVCLDGHPSVRETLLAHEKQDSMKALEKDKAPQISPTHADSQMRFFGNLKLIPLVSKYKLAGTSQYELEKCLRRAAADGSLEDISVLIKHGVNVNARDRTPGSEKSALEWAQAKGQHKCEALLLEAGAIPKQDVRPEALSNLQSL